MGIAFDHIPYLRTGGVFTEFNASRAVQGAPRQPHRAMLFVPMLSSGTLTPGVPTRVFSIDDGKAKCGVRSIGAAMIAAFKRANPYTELWVIGAADAASGVAASATVTLAVTNPKAGTICLYIAGERIAVGVQEGATKNEIETAIADAVNARELPVTADGAAGLKLTCTHKGALGNLIDVRFNYHQGEKLPDGVTCAVVPTFTLGATDPDLEVAVAALGAEQRNTICSPWTAVASVQLLTAELARRWLPTVQQEGHLFIGLGAASLGALTDLVDGLASKHLTAIGAIKSPTPPWIWGAVTAAVDAAETDPARPRKTLALPGLMPPAKPHLCMREEREVLLACGISTFTVDASNNVAIERLVTTHTTNALGVADPTFVDITTPRTLSYLRYSWNDLIERKYPRHKLARDGTDFDPDQPVVTPSVIKAEALGLFKKWERAGLVEGRKQFETDLSAEIDAGDSNRMNMVMVPDLIGQFLTLASRIDFML
mgnify:CR=1 FL=1